MPVITVGAFSGEQVHTVVGRVTHNLVYLRIKFMTKPGMLVPSLHVRKAGWGPGYTAIFAVADLGF